MCDIFFHRLKPFSFQVNHSFSRQTYSISHTFLVIDIVSTIAPIPSRRPVPLETHWHYFSVLPKITQDHMVPLSLHNEHCLRSAHIVCT